MMERCEYCRGLYRGERCGCPIAMREYTQELEAALAEAREANHKWAETCQIIDDHVGRIDKHRRSIQSQLAQRDAECEVLAMELQDSESFPCKECEHTPNKVKCDAKTCADQWRKKAQDKVKEASK